MKNLLWFAVLLMISGNVLGQSKAVDEFHNTFKDNGKYLSVHIEGGLLKMLSSIETNDEEAQEFIDAVSKIDGIKVHSIDKNEDDLNLSAIKKFKKSIKKEDYEELMIVRDGSTTVDFLIKEKKGRIRDLLLVIDEDDEFILLNITGEIDLKTIAKLSDNFDLKGGKHLKEIEEKE